MAEISQAESVIETRGFIKCLIGPQTEDILGFATFGQGTSDDMTCVQIAIGGETIASI